MRRPTKSGAGFTKGLFVMDPNSARQFASYISEQGQYFPLVGKIEAIALGSATGKELATGNFVGIYVSGLASARTVMQAIALKFGDQTALPFPNNFDTLRILRVPGNKPPGATARQTAGDSWLLQVDATAVGEKALTDTDDPETEWLSPDSMPEDLIEAAENLYTQLKTFLGKNESTAQLEPIVSINSGEKRGARSVVAIIPGFNVLRTAHQVLKELLKNEAMINLVGLQNLQLVQRRAERGWSGRYALMVGQLFPRSAPRDVDEE